MDPLSDMLSLLKPRSYVSGAFALDGDLSIQFPEHAGIKCYAMIAGECWLKVEGMTEAARINAGDCFLLPRGFPFCLTTDLSLQPVHYSVVRAAGHSQWLSSGSCKSERFMVGGHFVLSGGYADVLRKSLPPVVHIRKESDKAAMRWSLERMKEELRDPQPGSSLITQQLAYMMLIQALRLYIADGPRTGVGWLFALGDAQMSAAITCMHNDPGHPWTLQKLAERVGVSRSVFALRFKEIVGTTPMEYLTHWRMLLAADKLMGSSESIAAIAASLGYESESAFGKAFKRELGCSPRKYTCETRSQTARDAENE